MASDELTETQSLMQSVVDESIEQFERSRLRALILEIFAYVVGILIAASAIFSLVVGSQRDDQSARFIFVPVFLSGIIAFFMISSYAQILRNSAHQLRVSTYDFMLTHDSADEDYDDLAFRINANQDNSLNQKRSNSPKGSGSNSNISTTQTGRAPTEPQWANDPTGRHEFRYWNGNSWTKHVYSNGVESIDSP